MAWSVEQVLSLAPDAASAAAGRGLASAVKWQSAGRNEVAAWGEAKGSGAKPYQTVVDLGDGASKCSCPSRKFPCKHALGLLLRVAQNEVPVAEAVAWATEWLDKRGGRAVAKAEKAAAPPRQADPKSAEKRWTNVLRGLEECETFLCDVASNGLLSMSSARSWDEMAARMVDAQAPGVARRLRRLGETIGVGADWGKRAASELGNLTLLTAAARNIDVLGELAPDVRTALGIPFRKEDLPETEGVADDWDVLGAAVEQDLKVMTYRTWLRGRRTGRWAMHLSFSVGGVAPARPLPGRSLSGEAVFFPSAWPLRAQFEELSGSGFEPGPGEGWAEALEAYADALALNPWLDAFPVLLNDAALGCSGDQWLAVDSRGEAIPLRLSAESRWGLLARTGNTSGALFGEFDGETLRLLSAWGEGGFVEL